MWQAKKRIICYAREAGGAEAVAPVVEELIKDYDATLLAREMAQTVFEQYQLPFLPVEANVRSDTYSFLREQIKEKPHFLFTSASSLPQNDMTDRYLWCWARERGVKSMAILDQWQRYCERFSGLSKNEHMVYLPDKIGIMDEYAREEMIKLGFHPDILAVTGQPSFDRLRKYSESKMFKRKRVTVRKHVGAENDEKTIIVVFVSEKIRRGVLKSELNYDETKVILALIKQLRRVVVNDKQKRIWLVIKPHPNNNTEDFSSIPFGSNGKLVVQLSPSDLPGRELIEGADLVIGMSSVLLVESAIIGVPVVSAQIGSSYNKLCVLSAQGYIPFVNSDSEMGILVRRLLYDTDFRKHYLKRQTGFCYHKDAVKNVKTEIDRMME
ncbi:MAG: hypothetical protein ACE5H1_10935 [Thermodesulfobacteriota bacterium]